MSEDKSTTPTRIHPDDRKRIEASNQVARLYYGSPKPQAPISYYTPLLIQCTLPHSDPKTPVWTRSNGDFTLIVSTGYDNKGEAYGIPYGSFPRLMLAHIITRIIQTGERRIELTAHFSSFLKEIGYTGNLKGNIRPAKAIQSQIDRLIFSSISWERSQGTEMQGQSARARIDVASKAVLWWDCQQPDQGSFFGSWIELSEDFYKAVLSAPVPLRTDILAALKKSPLALDAYMWASYRLYGMQQSGQDQIALSYGRLQEQFGSGMGEKNYRLFRSRLKHALDEVAKYWCAPNSDLSQLHYEFGETDFVLYRSPLLIGKAKPNSQSAAERILTSRTFDAETKKKARLISGTWSVDFLKNQYFDWIEAEGITPKDPTAHFFAFIKAHRKRHGESI